MRREVKRSRGLQAFRIDLPQLEALLIRIVGLFPSTPVSQVINVRVGDEELEFANVEEMRTYADLPSRITSFRIRVSEGSRRVSLAAERQVGTPTSASVSAEAETPAWCAGAVETVDTFLRGHRQWYFWFRGGPLLIAAILAMILPAVALALAGVETVAIRFLAPSIAGFIALLGLYLMEDRLFPVAVLEVRQVETAIRQYMPELTLFMAALALVLTILGWFLAK
jgi:hypothetical protein